MSAYDRETDLGIPDYDTGLPPDIADPDYDVLVADELLDPQQVDFDDPVDFDKPHAGEQNLILDYSEAAHGCVLDFEADEPTRQEQLRHAQSVAIGIVASLVNPSEYSDEELTDIVTAVSGRLLAVGVAYRALEDYQNPSDTTTADFPGGLVLTEKTGRLISRYADARTELEEALAALSSNVISAADAEQLEAAANTEVAGHGDVDPVDKPAPTQPAETAVQEPATGETSTPEEEDKGAGPAEAAPEPEAPSPAAEDPVAEPVETEVAPVEPEAAETVTTDPSPEAVEPPQETPPTPDEQPEAAEGPEPATAEDEEGRGRHTTGVEAEAAGEPQTTTSTIMEDAAAAAAGAPEPLDILASAPSGSRTPEAATIGNPGEGTQTGMSAETSEDPERLAGQPAGEDGLFGGGEDTSGDERVVIVDGPATAVAGLGRAVEPNRLASGSDGIADPASGASAGEQINAPDTAGTDTTLGAVATADQIASAGIDIGGEPGLDGSAIDTSSGEGSIGGGASTTTQPGQPQSPQGPEVGPDTPGVDTFGEAAAPLSPDVSGQPTVDTPASDTGADPLLGARRRSDGSIEAGVADGAGDTAEGEGDSGSGSAE